jgi:hypothetical protein
MKKYMNVCMTALCLSGIGSVSQATPIEGFDLCKSGFPLQMTSNVQNYVAQGCGALQANNANQAFEFFNDAVNLLLQQKAMLHYIFMKQFHLLGRAGESQDLGISPEEVIKNAHEMAGEYQYAIANKGHLSDEQKIAFCNLRADIRKAMTSAEDHFVSRCLSTRYDSDAPEGPNQIHYLPGYKVPESEMPFAPQPQGAEGFQLCGKHFFFELTPEAATDVAQGCRAMIARDEMESLLFFTSAFHSVTQQADMLSYILLQQVLELNKEPLGSEEVAFLEKVTENAFDAVHDHMVALGDMDELTPALRDVFCNLAVNLMGKVVPNFRDYYTKESCLGTTFGASQEPGLKINLRDESKMINRTIHNVDRFEL